jgi:hydroxymethylpyrimidine/phosphomethylpyrimidine kinase
MELLPGVPLILDPVIASDRGDALANADFARTLLSRLAPRAILMTPNLPEARLLSGIEDGSPDGCAAELLRYLRGYLLIKGTHDDTSDVVHRLYYAGRPPVTWKFPRRPGTYHGSGCTLASAVAAYLAHGQQMNDAVTAALAYTFRSVFKAYKPGQGQFVPDRLGACRA